MSGIGINIGQRPQNRRQRVIKLLWTSIWLAYLSAPVGDLLHGGHSTGVQVLGWLGVVAFVAWYFALIFRAGRGRATAVVLGSLAVLTAQSTILALSLGREWLVLFVYVSVASGAALPTRLARLVIPAVAALLTLIALAVPGGTAFLAGLLLPALLGGFSMSGVRELIRTTVELREVRATVAQLAANEERLRLARDLHDLLGHSLSLITLKSELAGRMLPAHPDKAARQVADIEQVSLQALVDVREAVTGYRRPRLPAELAGARVALTAAGVTAHLPDDPDLMRPPRGERVGPGLGAARGGDQCRTAQRRPPLHGGPRPPPDPRRPRPRTLRRGRRHRRLGHRPRQRPHRPHRTPGQGGRLPGGGRHPAGIPAARPRPRRLHRGRRIRPMTSRTIKVLLAEDQSMVREALAALLGLEDDIEVVVQVARGDEVLPAAREHDIDVALLDIEMPGATGIEAAALLHKELPAVKLVVLTTFGRPGYLRSAMESGADAFLVKDAPASQLAAAVRKVLAGERVIDPTLAAAALAEGANPLTDREREILRAAEDGSTNAELAAALHLSQGTVRNYLSTAIQKLAVRNRAEAVRIAREKGWL